MTSYNFKGDLEQVSERQLAYIEEVLKEKGIKGPEVKLEPVGAVGDNYIANVKRIIAENDGTPFKMIAKLASGNPFLRYTANVELMFSNEHIVYTEILPKFKQLQIEADLRGDELFRYPECYGSLSEAPNEVILLEDLKEAKLENLDRFKSLSNECVKAVLKNLAMFHAFSYVLKTQEPETFSSIKSRLQDLFNSALINNEHSAIYFQHLEAMALGILQEEKHIKAIKGTIGDLFNVAAKCAKAEKDSKFAVIRQGDGWTNNIMFRMEDGLPAECVLIDYQMACESSPVYDIMYMLFNSTDHEQRHKHYYEFIDHYHKELDNALQNFNLKANLVYPRDQLDADLKRYGKYAMATSVLISNVIIKKTEDAAKMKEAMNNEMTVEKADKQFFDIDPETMLVFKKKLEDLADSFLEFGLL